MTKEFIEANGYVFFYKRDISGSLQYVSILRADTRSTVCTHTNEWGVISALSRRNYDGSLISKKGLA